MSLVLPQETHTFRDPLKNLHPHTGELVSSNLINWVFYLVPTKVFARAKRKQTVGVHVFLLSNIQSS